MEVPNKWIPKPELRRWLYGVLVGVGLLLVTLGVIDGTIWESIDRLLTYALMIGSGGAAFVNTPTRAAVSE